MDSGRRGRRRRSGPARAVAVTAKTTAGVPVFRLAGFYFAYFAILGSFLPYWPLYLQALGHDAAAIGWIMAMGPASKVLSPSLWGWFADRSGRCLSLIRWTSALSLVAFLGVFTSQGLAWLIAVTLLFTFFWNGVMPLFETLVLGHLHRDTGAYSRIRLWGSVGFIGAVYVVGEALDGRLSMAHLPWLVAALFGVQWLASLALPGIAVSHDHRDARPLGEILRQGGVVGLLLASFLHQAAHGPYYVFFSVYLERQGYSRSATGQLWALGVVAEILIFLVTAGLIRLAGLRALLLASFALSIVRWLLIAFGIANVAVLIGAQLLHAASFGSAHAAAILLVHRYFRGPHHATGQALYSSLSFGLGGAVGSYLGGRYWDSLGPQWVFAGAAVASLLALVAAWPRVGRGAHAGY